VRDYAWSSWPEYLKPPEGRPRWLRVDRLLGELHIPQDSAAGQEQLEAYLEQRRTGEDGDELKGIRRGWCLGGETFRQELLEQARARAGENHHAQTRRESAEEKAQRIRQAELDKLGWREGELAQRDKGDAGKIRIARRLRSETSVPLKWIAEALKMGSWMYVASRLNRKKEVKGTNDQNQLNLV
jgi:hypothetical protein